MRSLQKKLLRDLWHNRGQVVSIAAVVATAIMTVLSMRGTYESLLHSRDTFYQESAFPHVWAGLERAPESVKDRIAAIDGVSAFLLWRLPRVSLSNDEPARQLRLTRESDRS
ncbi:MAG: hypothetical protein ACPG8N_04495 [Rhodothermales bacterium]